MTKLKHYNNLGTGRFLTFSCHKRYKLLEDDKVKSIFLKHLDEIRNKYSFNLLGYVIMPTHIHIVIYPQNSMDVGKVIGELKSLSAREILKYLKEIEFSLLANLKIIRDGVERYAFWQRRCYDHNCRGQSAVLEKINYCHNNPVNSEITKTPEEWPWSSVNWYNGSSDSLIEIDDFEMNKPTASGGAPRSLKIELANQNNNIIPI